MNKIERLIEKLCFGAAKRSEDGPTGVDPASQRYAAVEWKTLGELGEFFSGLSGKTKDDFKEGNAKFITYMNVYSNLALRTDVPDRVKVAVGEKQNTLEKGDVLFTGSSETPDECGMSSVVTVDVTEPLYLNSFCFGFRLADKKLFNPDFLKHLLRSTNIRHQITRTASGVTRFNVSKAKMAKVSLPVPPLEVQSEIVQILDNFAKLTAELTAELAKRKKQYEHYRDTLLSGDWPRVKLGEVCEKICSGGTPSAGKTEYYGGDIQWLRTQEVDWVDITDTSMKITQLGLENSSAKWIKPNCVIVAMYGATAGKVAINKIPLTTNQACCNLQIDPSKALYRFVFHWLSHRYLHLKSLGQGSQSNINAAIVKDYEIPLPPLAEQERIVGILDKFDKLVNSLTEGLPAEIAAREKQYAYYRDKLLSFGKGE